MFYALPLKLGLIAACAVGTWRGLLVDALLARAAQRQRGRRAMNWGSFGTPAGWLAIALLALGIAIRYSFLGLLAAEAAAAL